jgi:hypothetical protein
VCFPRGSYGQSQVIGRSNDKPELPVDAPLRKPVQKETCGAQENQDRHRPQWRPASCPVDVGLVACVYQALTPATFDSAYRPVPQVWNWKMR